MVARRMGLAACILAVLLLAVALVSGALAQTAQATKPQVSDVWIRLPAVAGRPAAGYLMIMGGTKADRLTGVTSPLAARVEMHETKSEGGAMRMLPVKNLDVAAGSHIMFMPGDKHLMLFGLSPTAKPGAKIPLTLTFANSGSVTVEATARAAGEAAPSSPGHGHH